jgi:hypothetical protein
MKKKRPDPAPENLTLAERLARFLNLKITDAASVERVVYPDSPASEDDELYNADDVDASLGGAAIERAPRSVSHYRKLQARARRVYLIRSDKRRAAAMRALAKEWRNEDGPVLAWWDGEALHPHYFHSVKAQLAYTTGEAARTHPRAVLRCKQCGAMFANPKMGRPRQTCEVPTCKDKTRHLRSKGAKS